MSPHRAAGAWPTILALLFLLGAGWAAYAWAQEAGSETEPAAEELETFVPTEEVGAEQAVAFPVDI